MGKLFPSYTIPEPGPKDVRVRVEYAPINPADLNVLTGTYGKRLQLPGIPGNEGVGVVTDVGDHVQHIQPGDRVIAPTAHGFWCEQMVIPAVTARVVPPAVAPRQAAMLRVNPPTAWAMLTELVTVGDGDWIAQNAANSAVGRLVIAIARARGIHTANVVRRAELVDDLCEAGADIVELADGDFGKRIAAAAGPISLALNAVGGDAARELTRALAAGGTMVTYGAMSLQPLPLAAGQLIFKDLRFCGFWVSRWLETAAPATVEAAYAEIFALAAAGALDVPIAQTYPLAELSTAIDHAAGDARGGKILLQLS
jgi:trans-2-enoyl-CoA reductase